MGRAGGCVLEAEIAGGFGALRSVADQMAGHDSEQWACASGRLEGGLGAAILCSHGAGASATILAAIVRSDSCAS